MNPIADMVAEMLARGVPHDIIVLAVKAAEQAARPGISGGIPVDQTAEKRRAYDRERKAAKKNSGGIPVEIPRNSETPSSSEEVLDQGRNKKEAKRKTGTEIPVEWEPTAEHYAQAAKFGMGRAWVDDQAQAMRDWAGANGHRAVARKLNWDLTFSGWLRRAAPPPDHRKSALRIAPAVQRDWDGLVAKFKAGGLWTAPGPEPGYGGCEAPPDILAKHGYGPSLELNLARTGTS